MIAGCGHSWIMTVDRANERTLGGVPRNHERQPMGTRGCKVCVFGPEHPVHQGAQVVSIFRDRRKP